MALLNKIFSFSQFDLLLAVIFIIYLVLPIRTPEYLAQSNISIGASLFFLTVTVLLFMYTNPIIAILYIFVVYEIVRRSYETIKVTSRSYSVPNIESPEYQDSRKKEVRSKVLKPKEMPTEINGPESSFSNDQSSLETEMVNKMSPIGRSDIDQHAPNSSFSPVYDKIEKIGSASVV